MTRKNLLVAAFFIAVCATPTKLFAGTFNYEIVITLSDTTNTSKIKVALGNSEGASDILQHDFLYDVISGLPAGTVYKRKGNEVHLTLGTFNIGTPLFCDVIIEDNSGEQGSVKKYRSR